MPAVSLGNAPVGAGEVSRLMQCMSALVPGAVVAGAASEKRIDKGLVFCGGQTRP